MGRGRNWRAKYLTLDEWRNFKKNDFRHLSWKVNTILILLLAIIAAVIARFITG